MITSTRYDKPVRLGPETVLHLAADLSIRPIDVDTGYWDHRADRTELADGRVLSVYAYTATWKWWERHPIGDELAYLLSGQAELNLDYVGGHREVSLRPGEAVVIPAGAWHTLRVVSPSMLMFVTPTPAATEHRPIP